MKHHTSTSGGIQVQKAAFSENTDVHCLKAQNRYTLHLQTNVI